MLQGLVGGVAAFFTVVSLYFRKFKAWFYKLLNRSTHDSTEDENNEMLHNAGSFRDPAARVYEFKNRIYRSIQEHGRYQ